jgi:hypothetical protein
MSAEERLGWRDQALSERHRLYGLDCPAVDIDFLMLEYNYGQPVALIDYKFHVLEQVDVEHPSLRAISILADRGAIPFFVVRYWRSPWSYAVEPINVLANDVVQEQTEMSEVTFVRFLYDLRGSVPPTHVTDRLDTDLPPSLTAEVAWL